MKNNFRMAQESFEKYTLHSKKRISRSNFCKKQVTTALYYLADEVTAQKVANSLGIEKSTISKIIRRLCFYFRKLFPCICLTQQHHYFANRTSYKTSLLIANYFFLLYNLHKIYISNKTNQKTFTKN